MNRKVLFLLAVCMLASFLAACSSAMVSSVYTAAGDSNQTADLNKTTTFAGDDDLNVVIKLGAHNRTLAIKAIFNAPTGASYATDVLEANETVGMVLLGLDWESQGAGHWPAGEWSVDVWVDEKKEKTLTFTVTASDA